MNPEIQYEDELSLDDIIRVLKAYRRSILIIPIIIAFLAFLFAWVFLTPNYEAQATIDIGKVNEVLLETPYVLVDRLNQSSFIDRVVGEHPKLFEDDPKSSNTKHFKSFKAKKNKDSELVSFVLTSKTRERAFVKAGAILDTLQHVHRKIYDNQVAVIQQQISLLDSQIDELKLHQPNSKLSSTDSYGVVLNALIINDRMNQLRTLMNRKMDLEAGLNPAKTYNTKLLEEVYVSEDPVGPNVLMIALIAFLFGLFGVIFVAFMRDSLARSTT